MTLLHSKVSKTAAAIVAFGLAAGTLTRPAQALKLRDDAGCPVWYNEATGNNVKGASSGNNIAYNSPCNGYDPNDYAVFSTRPGPVKDSLIWKSQTNNKICISYLIPGTDVEQVDRASCRPLNRSQSSAANTLSR